MSVQCCGLWHIPDICPWEFFLKICWRYNFYPSLNIKGGPIICFISFSFVFAQYFSTVVGHIVDRSSPIISGHQVIRRWSRVHLGPRHGQHPPCTFADCTRHQTPDSRHSPQLEVIRKTTADKNGGECRQVILGLSTSANCWTGQNLGQDSQEI